MRTRIFFIAAFSIYAASIDLAASFLSLLLLLLLHLGSSYCSWTECGHERRQPKNSKKLEGVGGDALSPPDALQPVGCWLFVVCCCILGLRIA